MEKQMINMRSVRGQFRCCFVLSKITFGLDREKLEQGVMESLCD